MEKSNFGLTPVLILIVLLTISGCRKSEISGNPELIIDAGFVCGWGSGADSINISQSSITYRYWVPATSAAPVINKTRSVSESEWKEISSAVNLYDFVRLSYQSCNVCVDGCDEWISVTDGKISHKITFDKGLQIETISKLQAKLSELRAEFSK